MEVAIVEPANMQVQESVSASSLSDLIMDSDFMAAIIKDASILGEKKVASNINIATQYLNIVQDIEYRFVYLCIDKHQCLDQKTGLLVNLDAAVLMNSKGDIFKYSASQFVTTMRKEVAGTPIIVTWTGIVSKNGKNIRTHKIILLKK